MSQHLHSEIIKFINGLPYWQKYLAAYTLNRVDSEQDEILDDAFHFFLAENGLGEQKPLVELAFPAAVDNDNKSQIEGLKLIAIKNLKNVNAIRGGQTLPIEKLGVTAIGGLNGAGKSSIARLLNSVFYSRGDSEILPNIFEPGDGEPPSAVFIFEKADGTIYELTYIADGNHDHAEFRQFASFDTHCVNIHLNEENELHVPPNGFYFFRELADLTTKISQNLADEIAKISTVNTFTELLDGNSEIKKFILGLNHNSATDDIKQKLKYADTSDERVSSLKKEIDGLNVNGIEAKKKELSDVKTQLSTLKTRIDANSKVLSKENLSTVEAALIKISELKRSIQEKGSENFKDSGIKGVGTDTWKIFIQGSQQLALVQHEHYPAGEDKCLFCTQDLDDASVKHIKSYWEFLNSDSETQLKTSIAFLEKKKLDIATVRASAPDDTSALALWLSKYEPEESKKINDFLTTQKTASTDVSNSLGTLIWSEVILPAPLLIDSLIEKVEKELATVDTKIILEKKTQLEEIVTNLSHQKKMSEKLTAVIEWVDKQKWLKKALEIKNSTSTKSITDAGKTLFDEHVTKKYRQLFHQECQDLNARFRLELTQKGRGGKSQRKYQIEGYPPGKILSEGEQRAVSLADFITELKISGINSGWVFDDPVNSQDVERKDVIAKKLVMEARERQIIVFSHDITFLYDLNGWADQLGLPFKCHWVERQGLDAGVIYPDAPPNFEAAYINPDKAEKKHLESKNTELDPMERENRIKEGFSCLRTSYEAFVVQKMLAKVVVRFDRRLGYQHIESIYAPPEWRTRVLNKLKKLSGYIEGHSHSDINYKPLKSEQLEAEIIEYKEMKKEFDIDRKAADKAFTDKSLKASGGIGATTEPYASNEIRKQ